MCQTCITDFDGAHRPFARYTFRAIVKASVGYQVMRIYHSLGGQPLSAVLNETAALNHLPEDMIAFENACFLCDDMPLIFPFDFN